MNDSVYATVATGVVVVSLAGNVSKNQPHDHNLDVRFECFRFERVVFQLAVRRFSTDRKCHDTTNFVQIVFTENTVTENDVTEICDYVCGVIRDDFVWDGHR